jgi:CO/xanthine dehydrogenase FAD-binding subunit
MPRVVSYHRPNTLTDALTLLRRAGVETRVLGGGTSLNAGFQDLDASPIEVVDLQALDLAGILEAPGDTDSSRLNIGAMTTLGALVGSPLVPETLRDLARSEAPLTLRNMATVGGTIGSSHWESAFVAGLLAHRATVTIAHADSTRTLALAEFVRSPGLLDGSVLTAVEVEVPLASAWETVRRTPADAPIVAVVGARYANGVVLAVAGGAPTPFVLDPTDVINPPGDFRGSSAYRQEIIRTLIDRVTNALHPTSSDSSGATS